MNLSKFQTPAPRGGVPLEHRFDDTLKLRQNFMSKHMQLKKVILMW